MNNSGNESYRVSFMTNKNASQNNVDRSCLFNFRKGIIRIEYPGHVKNESEAISTLGGMYGIESAIADFKNKLDLCLNPKNMLCKPISADRDNSAGILIRIKKNHRDVLDYDVVAVVTTHFKFNRLAEFVYLPLMPQNGAECDAEYIYDKLFPDKLPTFEWLICRESVSMPAMLFPPCSARNEYCNQNKLGHFHQAISREKHIELPNKKKQPRTLTYYISFQNINTEVPDQPCSAVMEKVRSKGLMDDYLFLKKLFDERPIYQRSAIRFLTRFLNDNLKILLPAVAYYCTLGPWRTTWIRYGYNPQKDFNSRKYQTLDFRLKSNTDVNMRARQKGRQLAKLNYSNAKDTMDESCYLLKPNIVPPRRQKMYQYCDILLPEIQEMLQRLPKLPTYVKYDLKNGWFPARFIEQSREIVRNHMRELLRKRYQEERLRQTDAQISGGGGDEKSVAYGSRMLSNLARGRHRSLDEPGISSQDEDAIGETEEDIDIIDLIDVEDDEEGDERDQERLFQAEAEQMDRDYNSDENSDNSSEYEIDTEALEEINKMVSGAGSIFK